MKSIEGNSVQTLPLHKLTQKKHKQDKFSIKQT